DDKEPEELLYRYADLLAVGTVGDVMPLIYENRSVVQAGVEIIKKNPRAGIGAIIGVSGMDKTSISAGKIAYGIVPRINAAGRMGSAERALDLLKCENMLEALKIANEIDDANIERQGVEKRIMNEAVEKIEEKGYKYNRVIVVSGENWHLGVVGIVASRISEKYGKPAFVIGIEEESAHGSGRSVGGFSLYDAMSSCSASLTKFGGHAMAGGLSLNADKIGEFRSEINEYAAKFSYMPPELHLDCRINPAGMTVDLVDSVKLLEPFGTGNPQPVFGIFEAKLDRITPIGSGKHLKLLFYKGNNAFQALLFGVTPEQFCFDIGDVLDLAVVLEGNYYKDNYTLSVQIKALRMSGNDYDSAFAGLSAYHDYCSGVSVDCNALLPTREQVGVVYKEICAAPVLKDRIGYLHINDLGYAKTEVAILTLCELGLITENKGILSAVKGASRTELMNSPTYKKICEEGKQ
ncbi:MAG: single-stranded-DNA-specific exonuclease RecJ, partial [Clostridia bacterium]|nr:single-stranded-DNA-specific exonuclease RecJ [Clostridia bacterium]